MKSVTQIQNIIGHLNAARLADSTVELNHAFARLESAFEDVKRQVERFEKSGDASDIDPFASRTLADNCVDFAVAASNCRDVNPFHALKALDSMQKEFTCRSFDDLKDCKAHRIALANACNTFDLDFEFIEENDGPDLKSIAAVATEALEQTAVTPDTSIDDAEAMLFTEFDSQLQQLAETDFGCDLTSDNA